ncbi:hypothetical protein Pst134EA_028890 [Puccinia striiformis f. sp. tritici]|uniref:uncharacterized protein n=1 Tax=Puccinia striiformis f. sp. tritici TaxID=168172 RepID=UPI002008DBD1|nr:uncharacterized protein Pst134EA_032674 [Puccinia striiformis f. sp. tritici]XP_047797994.1 hypothetical protein Pst134EA_028890 [Puccinia striiformis f. sp. tritici]KAH9441684.1 hypothetical protein Pst134EA_032674 [Puccinia striiformis f. sp. tritici]KAH9446904.1 hypothetical protein Pst134EA_028890 [Puccinia striiformis f. sp. tritici]
MRSFAILAALVMAVSQVTANAEKSHAPASSPADGPAMPPTGGPHPPPPAGSHPGPAGPPVPMVGDMTSGECMCPPPPACPAMGAIAPGPNSVIPINGTMANNATVPNNGTMSNNGTIPNNGTTSDDDEDTDSVRSILCLNGVHMTERSCLPGKRRCLHLSRGRDGHQFTRYHLSRHRFVNKTLGVLSFYTHLLFPYIPTHLVQLAGYDSLSL